VEVLKKEEVEHFTWVTIPNLNQFAFPKTLKEFMQQHLL
jgi:hypothetical protein